MEFPGAVPNIKDYQVSMDGDIVRGQFLTQIAGKDVYLTLAGHLGSKDGYATFDATELRSAIFPCPRPWSTKCCRKDLPSSAISSSCRITSKISKSKTASWYSSRSDRCESRR